jgi:hypothetical protein
MEVTTMQLTPTMHHNLELVSTAARAQSAVRRAWEHDSYLVVNRWLLALALATGEEPLRRLTFGGSRSDDMDGSAHLEYAGVTDGALITSAGDIEHGSKEPFATVAGIPLHQITRWNVSTNTPLNTVGTAPAAHVEHMRMSVEAGGGQVWQAETSLAKPDDGMEEFMTELVTLVSHHPHARTG